MVASRAAVPHLGTLQCDGFNFTGSQEIKGAEACRFRTSCWEKGYHVDHIMADVLSSMTPALPLVRWRGWFSATS